MTGDNKMIRIIILFVTSAFSPLHEGYAMEVCQRKVPNSFEFIKTEKDTFFFKLPNNIAATITCLEAQSSINETRDQLVKVGLTVKEEPHSLYYSWIQSEIQSHTFLFFASKVLQVTFVHSSSKNLTTDLKSLAHDIDANSTF
jgi:hypothetical protein